MRSVVVALVLACAACGSRSSLSVPEPLDATVAADAGFGLRLDDAKAPRPFACTDASAIQRCFAHIDLEQAAKPDATFDENNCLPLTEFRDQCCQPDYGPSFAWEETWGLQACCYEFCREACCGY